MGVMKFIATERMMRPSKRGLFNVTISIGGDKNLMNELGYKSAVRQRAALRRAMTKVGRVGAQQSKSLAPRETGYLRSYLAFRVWTKPSENVVGVVVGPRVSQYKYSKTFGSTIRIGLTKKKKKGKGYGRYRRLRASDDGTKQKLGYRDPAYYAHLVEFGHRIVPRGRRSAGTSELTVRRSLSHGKVSARPFLRPAGELTAPMAEDLIASELHKEFLGG